MKRNAMIELLCEALILLLNTDGSIKQNYPKEYFKLKDSLIDARNFFGEDLNNGR